MPSVKVISSNSDTLFGQQYLQSNEFVYDSILFGRDYAEHVGNSLAKMHPNLSVLYAPILPYINQYAKYPQGTVYPTGEPKSTDACVTSASTFRFGLLTDTPNKREQLNRYP